MRMKSKMPESHADLQDLPDGYRMTELGPLPEEWRVVRLGEIFEIVPKKRRERVIDDNMIYRLITVKLYAKGLELRAIKKGREIGTRKLYEVREGDFVFSKIDARNGAWGFVDKNLSGALVSGDFPILYLNREIADADYIMLWLSRAQSWKLLRNLAVGTTNRRRVQPQELLSVLFAPLPPLPEQRAIAYVLRVVQQAKEATEGVVAAARELKKSLMRHLFTYGPVPAGATHALSLQETEIGLLPKHWRVVRLGEVVTFTKRPKGIDFSTYDVIPFIPMDLVPDDGELVKYELRSSSAIRSGIYCEKGDILLAKITPSFENGKQGIVGEIPTSFAVATTEVYPIKANPKQVDRTFLFQYLKLKRVRSDIAGKMEGTTGRKRVPKRVIENYPIPLPPLAEQREIARILQAVDRKIEAEERRKEALDALFKTLLHHLMTAKIRLPRVFIERFAGKKEVI